MQTNPTKLTVKLTTSQLERALWLAGLAFERDVCAGYRVLLACLERNGTLGYMDSVPAKIAAPSIHTTSSLLVGQNSDTTVCKKCRLKRNACQCRRCIACQKEKDSCKCPFPRRIMPWGRAEYEEDLQMLDKLDAQLVLRIADHKITLEQFTKTHRWIEAMGRKCKAKLWMIRQRVAEANGEGHSSMTKAQQLPTPKAVYPVVINCNRPATDTGYRRNK